MHFYPFKAMHDYTKVQGHLSRLGGEVQTPLTVCLAFRLPLLSQLEGADLNSLLILAGPEAHLRAPKAIRLLCTFCKMRVQFCFGFQSEIAGSRLIWRPFSQLMP